MADVFTDVIKASIISAQMAEMNATIQEGECSNCGNKVAEDHNFCTSCGFTVIPADDERLK